MNTAMDVATTTGMNTGKETIMTAQAEAEAAPVAPPRISAEDQMRADLYNYLGVMLALPPDQMLLQQTAGLAGDESDLGSAINALAKLARHSKPATAEREFNNRIFERKATGASASGYGGFGDDPGGKLVRARGQYRLPDGDDGSIDCWSFWRCCGSWAAKDLFQQTHRPLGRAFLFRSRNGQILSALCGTRHCRAPVHGD